MAEYPAPREIVPIYNPENFTTLNDSLTIIDADGRYLKLTGGTETGLVTFNQGLTIPLTTNSTSSITGALICAGGLGLAQDFYTGGNLFLSGSSKRIYNQFGTAAAPSYTFSSDTNTGIYRVAADDIGFATNGVLALDISSTNVTSALPILAPAGTVGAPSISFSGDTDTGFYSVGANNIGLATNGARRLNIDTSAIIANLPLTYSISGNLKSGSIISGSFLNISFTSLAPGKLYLICFQVNFNPPGIALCLYGTDNASGSGRFSNIINNGINTSLNSGSGSACSITLSHAVFGTYDYIANIIRIA